MNKRRLIFFLKTVVLAAILGGVGRVIFNAWSDAAQKAGNAHVRLSLSSIDWRYGAIAVAGFCGVMLISGSVWRWLAWRMGDRSPTGRLLAAYTFSQMGKYIPGKIVLLLMRIERAGRFGMSAGVCTLSTLLENALYMISGGIVGMLAIDPVLKLLSPRIQPFVWPLAILVVIGLAIVCQPAIFYRGVGVLLKRMQRPPVAPEHRLGAGTLVLGVAGFVPCWICGGLALWATTCSLQPIPIGGALWFAGAFSLSAIIGMASPLPGGAGVREAVLGSAVLLQLMPLVGHDQAVLDASLVAVLQRVFQVLAELVLGASGAALTARRSPTACRVLEEQPTPG
ncbi:MAG TPA: lysylphosphatidylglycerol synthase domain-containing protein [Phycisphaerae bacterium]|nr:lysylphosphatidylglycerol synthase domain-containing protein [Phycisphaerae bacterium]